MSYHVIERLLIAARTSRRQRGVTLLELMAVVSILAILASIALPTYRRYLIRSQRTEAKIALLQLQTAQEKFYMQNNSFTDNITDASPDGLGLPGTTETGKYAIAVDLADDGQTYDATATPVEGGGQADDADCANFSINQRGTEGRYRAEPVCRPAGADRPIFSMMRGLRAALFFRSRAHRVRHSARMSFRFRALGARTWIAATLVVCLSSAAMPASRPHELKLATWNLEWFMKPETLRALTPACTPADAPRDGARRAVPCDVAHELARSSEDIAALAPARARARCRRHRAAGSRWAGSRAAGLPGPRVLFFGARRGAKQWLRDPPRSAVCLRSRSQGNFARRRCAARRGAAGFPRYRRRSCACFPFT